MRTETKKAAGVINQDVEETSSEEEENEDERGAAYTNVCIEHLMTLGQGHIGGNVGLEEDYISVSGYGFMEAPADPAGDDADKWKVQYQGQTNPLKKRGGCKKKQEAAGDVTSRNKKSVIESCVKVTKKVVIPKK